jgi:hypothetical protein
MNEGEGPALIWVREYNAKNISLSELAEKIAGHDFEQRKGEAEKPTPARALEYKDADYEAGTFDDIYRAQAYGLLTKQDMDTILAQVKQKEDVKGKQEPHFVCQAGASPADASLIELKAASEPYLVKVDDGYVKIKVTS